MKLLVTGGAGYIGSHVGHLLVDSGHEVVVLDNFYSGHRWAVPSGSELIEGDIGDASLLAQVFSKHKFDGVLHFAAHIEVPESVENPAKYYRNNTASALTLFDACVKDGVRSFIFSSTAAVYGEPEGHEGVSEKSPLKPLSPYGHSKLMSERILEDLCRASGNAMRFVALRYFNAAGARRDLKIGQATPRATHLIKVASQAAVGTRDFVSVFGTDYPTPDGSCLRDYIHIEDLAQAHLDALNYLVKGGASEVFNAGYGKANSVLEVIESMKRVSGQNFEVKMSPRRPGDPSVVVADSSKIKRVLGWQPKFDDLDLICRTAYEWEKKLQKLF
jgi:UDP-glucose 4-epimerase